MALVGISTAVVVRWQLLRDFHALREGEREDRVYLLTAELEGEIGSGSVRWERLAEVVARGLSAGMEIRLMDGRGVTVIDTASALAAMDQKRRETLRSLLAGRTPPTGGYDSYPLFVRGEEVGRIDVRFFADPREELFTTRSLTILVASSCSLLLAAVLLSLFAAGRISRPLKRLAELASGIADRSDRRAAPEEGADEIAEVARAFNRMNEALDRQEFLRKKLFANAAHELRTPLAAMRCELEGVAEGVIPLDSRLSESLLEEVRRLSGLVAGLEELARVESDSFTLDRRPVDLCRFLADLSSSLGPMAQEKGVSLSTTCDGEVVVSADPDRLTQMVMNLFSNALRATPAGGEITLSVERGKEEVLLSVADTGCGIDPDDLPHLFERFYRGSGGGLGIGLAIVRELVRGHGWRITAEGRPGEGSRFTVVIPS